jgi:hypothetical protein
MTHNEPSKDNISDEEMRVSIAESCGWTKCRLVIKGAGGGTRCGEVGEWIPIENPTHYKFKRLNPDWQGGWEYAIGIPATGKHPEDVCQQCAGNNVVWFADNEIWNAVVGGPGILCPSCFVQFADAKGYHKGAWKLIPEIHTSDSTGGASGAATPRCDALLSALRYNPENPEYNSALLLARTLERENLALTQQLTAARRERDTIRRCLFDVMHQRTGAMGSKVEDILFEQNEPLLRQCVEATKEL